MDKKMLSDGAALLNQPVLPLVSMVEFFLLTGDFGSAAEIIGQLPAPIETEYARYQDPQGMLAPYLDLLEELHGYLKGGALPCQLTDVEGKLLDQQSGARLLIRQKILERELEPINSCLCAPCQCSLCCVGPDSSMQQEFFEIPLESIETTNFPLVKIDTAVSRQTSAMSEPAMEIEGKPFYSLDEPALVRWQDRWGLVLPKGTSCPQLEQGSGRCLIYEQRPQVCRKPQIFAYILEKNGEVVCDTPALRQRSTILAVMDCPYVQALQEEIAAYAAACELEVLFTQNKG